MQPSTSKRWIVSPSLTHEAQENLCQYPGLLGQFLFNRGITTNDQADEFIDGRSPAGCDAWALKNMRTAVQRLRQAIDRHERVIVYGDYDADGVTATVLLVQVLRKLGADVYEFIPNRFDEGYGLNNASLDLLKSQGAQVIVTVDCGIRSLAEVDYGSSLGLDMLVTDHHHPLGAVPRALAVINPKQADDLYPDKNLAGVGVAFKLAQALIEVSPKTDAKAEDWLDLVAIGTVADLQPLSGENRALVKQGLIRMRTSPRPGVLSLAGVAGLDLTRVTTTDIGFILAPRLNASGRLDSALASFNLLMAEDALTAGLLAQKLDDQNTERKKITREIEEAVDAMAKADGSQEYLIFAIDESFNSGVVGLAASHIADAYHLPAIVGARGADETRCSCRSIASFHITQALDECADLLVRHGGHAAAAGFTVRNENLGELMERMQAIARRELAGRDLQPEIKADAEISLSKLDKTTMDCIDALQPFGLGNPEPVFVSRQVKIVNRRTVGKDSRHLKLALQDERVTIDAIGFGLGEWAFKLPTCADVIFTFERNEWNGKQSFQLNLKDIRPSEDA